MNEIVQADQLDVEKQWDTYLDKALKKSITPWYEVLVRMLLILPEPSVNDEPVTNPTEEEKAAVQAFVMPWYKSIFS